MSSLTRIFSRSKLHFTNYIRSTTLKEKREGERAQKDSEKESKLRKTIVNKRKKKKKKDCVLYYSGHDEYSSALITASGGACISVIPPRCLSNGTNRREMLLFIFSHTPARQLYFKVKLWPPVQHAAR